MKRQLVKLLGSAAMQEVEARSFASLGFPSFAIMEAAGRELTRLILDHCQNASGQGVLILVGKGNNGGDGYVAARHLLARGARCEVFSLYSLDELRGDALLAYRAWSAVGGNTLYLESEEDSEIALQQLLTDLTPGVIVDAVFGNGFHGHLPERVSRHFALISSILNFSESTSTNSLLGDSPSCPLIRRPVVVAVDMPSGVFADSGEQILGALPANMTLAIQYLKPCHLLYPAAALCGEIWTADVGILPLTTDLPQGSFQTSVVDEDTVKEFIFSHCAIGPDSYKNSRGHVVIIGGDPGKRGAALLAGASALASGAGLVTIAAVDWPPGSDMSFSVPEIMSCSIFRPGAGRTTEDWSPEFIQLISRARCLVIGPGLEESEGSGALLGQLLELAEGLLIPVVIDAGALGLVAADKTIRLSNRHVITPHPGEAGRMLGLSSGDIQQDRFGAAEKLVDKYHCVVLLKGAGSIVYSASGERSYIVPVASPALATAGSGDVLAGHIAALCCAGLGAEEAAVVGAWIHAKCGEEFTGDSFGWRGLLAGDLAQACAAKLNQLFATEFTCQDLSSCGFSFQPKLERSFLRRLV